MTKLLRSSILLLMLGILMSVQAQEPDGYYKNAEGKKKEQLKTSLSAIISSGFKSISYDGLLDAYKTTDKNASGYVYDIYSTCSFSFTKTCGNYSNVCDCYNREHTVPQSWFGSSSPMVSDIIHVLPTDGKVNGQRSNYPYGECATGTKLEARAKGRLGTCSYPSTYSGKVFEPDDEFKGDIARIYFYMATRYESKVGSWGGEAFGNGTYPGLKPWQIDVMLKWHRQDPVSTKEIQRNNAVYSLQKNRNPFVDHPELAEYVWGNKTAETWNLAASLEAVSTLKIFSSGMNIHIEGVSSPIAYRIYNISGALVKQGISESDCTIPMNISGIYIISVQTETSVINRKISI
ncbi:MAG: endonuclease [Bacteroidales bacterium]